MRQFVFRGFLPPEREERSRALRELDRETRPVIIMDTPYRLTRLLQELAAKWPERRALMGCDFTSPNEQIFEAALKDLPGLVGERKAEFILALFPAPRSAVQTEDRDSTEKRWYPPANRPASGTRFSKPGQATSRGPQRPKPKRHK